VNYCAAPEIRHQVSQTGIYTFELEPLYQLAKFWFVREVPTGTYQFHYVYQQIIGREAFLQGFHVGLITLAVSWPSQPILRLASARTCPD
jgi:hypothetical protein